MRKKAKCQEGVEARKLEMEQKKQIKELKEAKLPIPPALVFPIPDPKKI